MIRRIATIGLVALPSLGVSSAKAEPPSAKPAFGYEVTNQSSAIFSGDNRDTVSGSVPTFNNDDWALINNRLDTQISKDDFVFSLRLDGALFPYRPNATQVGLDMVDLRDADGGPGPGEPQNPVFFRQKVYESHGDLSNRYINWLIPAKYAASYDAGFGKLTVGDLYAQFGRGFVLSVRKKDALASDTTIRGARLSARAKWEKTRFKAVLLAGSGNPLRIDETSGRYLGSSPDARRGFQNITEAGMPWAIQTDPGVTHGSCAENPTCSYVPDNLYGAQIEIAPKGMKLSTQASILSRHTIVSEDIVRSSNQILTASQTLEFPNAVDFGALYLEGAGQNRAYREGDDKGGYALYGNLDLYAGPMQLLFEGKHYRAFYPLSAGINTLRASEFAQVQYSQVPTTEPVWNSSQFENFNTCTSGGRTKVDAHLSPRVSIFSWIGRYDSWAESVGNEECEIKDEFRNEIWDVAVGSDLTSADRRSKTNITVGIRDDSADRNLGSELDPTTTFYREGYARYDALFHLEGPYSVQFQGWHRYRNQAIGGPIDPWFAGTTTNALEIAPFGNIAVGVEYDTNPLTPDMYFNAQVTYRINEGSNVSLFAGQRRGEQRCVAGVCRVFPAFEGARMDLTLRL